MLFFFFFFKQKTAYEMRISDWSSTCALPIFTVAGVVDRPAARTQGERAVGFAARIPRSPVAAHLGVLRGFRHRRRPLAAAGQQTGTTLAAGRAAYLADKSRDGDAGQIGRAHV